MHRAAAAPAPGHLSWQAAGRAAAAKRRAPGPGAAAAGRMAPSSRSAPGRVQGTARTPKAHLAGHLVR
eukprot:scaffold94605_cov21-Phaeocystis_antarctica.AAC.1